MSTHFYPGNVTWLVKLAPGPEISWHWHPSHHQQSSSSLYQSQHWPHPTTDYRGDCHLIKAWDPFHLSPSNDTAAGLNSFIINFNIVIPYHEGVKVNYLLKTQSQTRCENELFSWKASHILWPVKFMHIEYKEIIKKRYEQADSKLTFFMQQMQIIRSKSSLHRWQVFQTLE